MPVGAGTSDVVTADLNGDGKLDLAVVASGDGSAGSGRVAVSLGNGAGGLGSFTTVRSGGAPTAIAAGDVNGDLVADLVVANSATANVTVLLNSGTGSFTATATLAVGATPNDVALDQIDRGRVLDVVAVSETGDFVKVWPGNNNGTFKAPVTTSVSNPVSLAVMDLNNDHMRDAVVASAADNRVRVLLGDRTGRSVGARVHRVDRLHVVLFSKRREPIPGAPIATPMRSGFVATALVIAALLVLALGILPGISLDVALAASLRKG